MTISEVERVFLEAKNLTDLHEFQESLDLLNGIIVRQNKDLPIKQVADINYLIASNMFHLGNDIQAIPFITKAYSQYKEVGSYDKLAKVSNNIGVLYKRTGNVLRAAQHLLEVVPLAIILNDNLILANCLLNLGMVWEVKGDTQRAFRALDIAISLCGRDNSSREIRLLTCKIKGNKATILGKQKKVTEALKLLESTVPVLLDIGDKSTLHTHMSNIAKCYIELGDFEKANTILKPLLKKGRSGSYQKVIDLMNAANIALNHYHNIETHTRYLEEARILAREGGFVPRLLEINQILLSSYKQTDNVKAALVCELEINNYSQKMNESKVLSEMENHLDIALIAIENRPTVTDSDFAGESDYLAGGFSYLRRGVKQWIPYSSIVYVEVRGNELHIFISHELGNKETPKLIDTIIRSTLKKFERDLDNVSAHFCRIHGSFFVNLNWITFPGKKVFSQVNIGGAVLSVSETYIKCYKQKLRKHRQLH